MPLKKLLAGSGLLAGSLLVCVGHTQVLHTLASPNEHYGGMFGNAVAGGWDVNNDGCDDLIVGASWEDLGTISEAGRAYVFSGTSGTLLLQLASPNPGPYSYFGYAVAGISDLDGDECDEVIVGAESEDSPAGNNNAGRAYVFSGATGTLLFSLLSPNLQSSGHFGCAVSAAGDINGDGHEDVLIGANCEYPEPGLAHSGRAYVFSGASGDVLHELVSPNEQSFGYFGESVSSAGDVDGDGFNDIIIGAHSEYPDHSPQFAGRAYVFSGASGCALWSLCSPNEETWGRFGWTVSGISDLNSDGYDDLIVGAPQENTAQTLPNAGRVYVFSGGSGSLLHTVVSPHQEEYGLFGYCVSDVDDLNSDGCSDIVIGAIETPQGYPDNAGRAYVLSGRTGCLLSELISPNPSLNSDFGRSVSGAGDVNNDGYMDIIMGARHEYPDQGPFFSGRAYVFTPMILAHTLGAGELVLEWVACPGASRYWVYGAVNETYFEPGTEQPYAYRLCVLPGNTTMWSSSNGIGDPLENWVYIVMAVNSADEVICSSNRVAEHDYSLPWVTRR